MYTVRLTTKKAKYHTHCYEAADAVRFFRATANASAGCVCTVELFDPDNQIIAKRTYDFVDNVMRRTD